MRRMLVCVVIGLTAAGCGGTDRHGAARSPAPTPARAAAGACEDVEGVLVHEPPGPRRPRPLVVAFHGLGESARGMQGRIGLDDVADRRGFVTAYPTIAEHGRWELNRRDGTGQLRRLAGSLDALVADGCADPARVTFTGFSNGAGFAVRAGCALADRVAAVVAVAGSYRVTERCPHRGPQVALLEIHGTRDPWLVTVPRLLRDWVPRNGCRGRPRRTQPRPGVTRVRWPGCAVERVVLAGTGHTWPAGFPYGVDPTGFDASRALWAFARDRSR